MVKLRRVIESELYLESKKDLDDLKNYLGDKLFDDYMKIRDRIPKDQNEFKDFSKLKKMDKKDIQDFVSSFQSKSSKRKSDKTEGAEKIYDGDEWVIYKITTYPAAQLYGKGTKWCITGRYPGHEEKGQEYFDSYIEDNNLDGGYYFLINKDDPSYKFCILRYASGGIDSMWNASDDDLVGVRNNEAPNGLLDYIDELPFGDEIEDYLEYTAGSDFDVSDALFSELGLDDSDQNIDRIIDYLDERIGFDELSVDNNLDYFYRPFESYSSGLGGFKELLKRFPPTSTYFNNHTLEAKFFDILLKDIKDRLGFYKNELGTLFFNTLLRDLFISHSDDEEIKSFKDKDLMFSLLKNCSDNVLKDNFHIYEGMCEALSDNLLSDKNFIKLCFDKGLSYRDFLYNIQDNSGEYNPKKWNDRVKTGVELGLDLNEDIGLSSDITPFYYILMSFAPSVDDVKWYLTHGADPDIKDITGRTAIDYASDDKIRELLS